ncbi:hypothetical protein [Brevundimonas lenta]|uniref:Uncharacterized protein n=1 Tax=Brevundimonas lenta TaxID=424796 RepID=A0A7W6JC04_9CAUL|nr:hypothetical protein [Brevundimonas lenta]MBB4082334.1 hypothetical protein [Brevundimonas lenta]
MSRVVRTFWWTLFIAYAVAGAVALMMATPAGLAFLGQPVDALTFLPARILALPWSLPLFFINEGPVATLAMLGICYGLNFGVTLMLARNAE